MTLADSTLEYHRWRAPSRDGETLQEPPIAAASELLRENQQRQQAIDSSSRWARSGLATEKIQAAARRQLLQLAWDYSGGYLDERDRAVWQREGLLGRDASGAASLSSVSPTAALPPIVLSGHQPQLFHPGVWFKNFALNSINAQTDAVTINLVIDNDLCHRPGIQVPSGSLEEPRWKFVPCDRALLQPEPWEIRRVQDESCFESFAKRVEQHVLSEINPELLRHVWKEATSERLSGLSLGARLAAARHRVEVRQGLQTLEVPLSHVVETPSFARFVAALLEEVETFSNIHNEALREYRELHGLRSKTHPVPDLQQRDGWYELPFWLWTREDPRRSHLYVRRQRSSWQLTNHEQLQVTLREGSLQETLVELPAQGICLRPRALMTTMYSRLLLSDLFLHGIGGAKYDQLTDVLIRRFWGVIPPRFMTLTATKRLPLPVPDVHPWDLSKLHQRQRDLTYHPETLLGDDPSASDEARQLARAKRQLLGEQPREGSRRPWHLAVTSLNEQMQPYLQESHAQLQAEEHRLHELLRQHKLLSSREMSFVLFPASLVDELREMARPR